MKLELMSALHLPSQTNSPGVHFARLGGRACGAQGPSVLKANSLPPPTSLSLHRALWIQSSVKCLYLTFVSEDAFDGVTESLETRINHPSPVSFTQLLQYLGASHART